MGSSCIWKAFDTARAPSRDCAHTRSAKTEELAATFLEPWPSSQGSVADRFDSGLEAAAFLQKTASFLAKNRQLLREKLRVFDEKLTAFGRKAVRF